MGCDTGHISSLINVRRPKRISLFISCLLYSALWSNIPIESFLTTVVTSEDEYRIHYKVPC
jgi:hypothetical protein